MQYACLVYLADEPFDAMTQRERDAMVNAALDSDERLKQGGNFVTAEALQHPTRATTVRVREGKVTTTDGPFIETKEYLSGFIVIEAKDLDEAIRLAASIPMATVGAIEVRPLQALEYIPLD